MIKKLLGVMLAVVLVFSAGCARVNPRLDQKLENQNGKIRDMETIQNGMKNELSGIKQNAEIQNSKLDHVQNGLANLQSSNTNTGIQILSGPGGTVIALFLVIVFGFIAVAYRKQALLNEKAADVMASRIVLQNNEVLEEDVFKAAMYTDVEEKVYGLIKKHQKNVIKTDVPNPFSE